MASDQVREVVHVIDGCSRKDRMWARVGTYVEWTVNFNESLDAQLTLPLQILPLSR